MRLILRLIGLVLVIVLVLGVSLFFLPSERITRIAEDQLSAQTGRRVTLAGAGSISVYPVLGVTTGKMSIANAEWSKAGPMLEADSLKIGVDLGALLRGDIHIKALEAVAPRIILERARDGRVNWFAGEATGGNSNALAVSLDRALIKNGSLKYVDHETGKSQSFSRVDMDLRWPDYKGAADIELVLRPAGADVTLTGKVFEFAQFLAGDVSPLNVVIRTSGGTAKFTGRGGIAPEAAGTLEIEASDVAALVAALGGSGGLPAELGRGLSLTGTATLTRAQQLSLREAVVTVSDMRFAGNADIVLGAKPNVTANLATGALDLSRFSGSGSGSGGEGWSTAPIDAGGLAAFDGKVAISAASLKAAGMSFGKTSILMTLDNARAVFSLRELQGYGGGFGGEFVMNNRNGLSVGGTLSAKGVEVRDVLGDLAGVTRLSGPASGQIKFLAVGNSMAKIMNSLKGQGQVAMGAGAISGFDLQRLMRAEDGRGGATGFDSMSATFTITDGVLSNNDLVVSMPDVTATGEGRVGIGARTIDYLFTPNALKARGGRGLAVPVRIRGPWAAPKITADIAKAIDLNLAEEKKKVEDKAKAKIEGAVAKELGVEVQEGQTLEDAVKKEVQDQAVKGLLKLLKP